MNQFEQLRYAVCTKCGEIHHMEGMGILARISHPCYGNTVTYHVGRFGYRMLKEAIEQLYGTYVNPFEGLLDFPSLLAMPDFDTATDLEKRWFQYERESDMRTVKRLRKYMELEDELLNKY